MPMRNFFRSTGTNQRGDRASSHDANLLPVVHLDSPRKRQPLLCVRNRGSLFSERGGGGCASSMRITDLLVIATTAKMFELKDDDGKPFFDTMSISLVCGKPRCCASNCDAHFPLRQAVPRPRALLIHVLAPHPASRRQTLA